MECDYMAVVSALRRGELDSRRGKEASVSVMGDNPSIDVPLPEYMEQLAQRIAALAADKAIEKHANQCPIKEVRERVKSLSDQVQNVRLNFAKMLGMLVGSGAIGGAFIKLFG